MAKAQRKPRISRAVRKGVFGQRGQQPRVGLYARVSTHDQQTLPMQLSAMRGYAKKRKWIVAVEVKDVGSGATTRPKREELIDAAGNEATSQDGLSKRAIAKQLGVSRTLVIRLLRPKKRSSP